MNDKTTKKSTGGPALSPQGASAARPAPLPGVALPKGGGAIRGIGEKLSVSPATGTIAFNVPIATPPGRSGFELGLSLSYDSSAGNGPFGLGFRLSLPSIQRKTDKGIPRYDASDTFVLSGAEDLVAQTAEPVERTIGATTYRVTRYRPRTEGTFARIELWAAGTGETHWRVWSKSNVLEIFGASPEARVTDPTEKSHVFLWLLEERRDDRGNVVVYSYKQEDGAGVDRNRPNEVNRFAGPKKDTYLPTAQRYLKRILYGNRTAHLDRNASPAGPTDDWAFEVVLDYGEHAAAAAVDVPTPEPDPVRVWDTRSDAFSSYRSGFELRTLRRCHRVLVYHHFEELGRPRSLVRSTDFAYAPSRVSSEDGSFETAEIASQLISITQASYVPIDLASYERASLPKLSLSYVRPLLCEELQPFPSSNGDGAKPAGAPAQWVDLDGEGMPGVLVARPGEWYYKRSLGAARLAAGSPLQTLPIHSDLQRGWHLADIGGDGNLDLISYAPPLAGYFERDGGSWASFVPFPSLPSIDWNAPDLRYVDLDGDGQPDVLVAGDEVFTWYRSRGSAGFEEGMMALQTGDEQQTPAIALTAGAESIRLADMSGDGLADLVRITNGEVCYWPNLGFGRFGRKITLTGSQRFEADDRFDVTRVRLADLDGSGTSDIVYLGPDGVRVYFNCAGNELSGPRLIPCSPGFDPSTSVDVIDLFGRGTSCLVISRALNESDPIAYVQLWGERRHDGAVDRERKPHVLTSIDNDMGGEIHITHAPSTKFHRTDRVEGRPWLTRLPFPVQVVEKVERLDRISGSSLVTRYAYRHGFYDKLEREFRGFARVDQWDSEVVSEAPKNTGADPVHALRQPTVHTRTWFHTGAWLEREPLESALAREYWAGDPLGPLLRDTPPLPGGSAKQEREAARALRGSQLRQEIYAEEGPPEKAARPFSVSERSWAVRELVAGDTKRHGVYLAHPSETFDVHYERAAADPRIAHQLVLAVDDFGNTRESASVGYGRRGSVPDLPPRFRDTQARIWVTYEVSSFTQPVDDGEAYRAPAPSEKRTYELTGATPGIGTYFSPADLRSAFRSASRLDFAASPTTGIERRRVGHERTIYRADDLSRPLPLGSLDSRAILHEQYSLTLTRDLLEQIYERDVGGVRTPLLPDLSTTLVEQGGYRSRSMLVSSGAFPSVDELTTSVGEQILLADDQDGDYWTSSGRIWLSAQDGDELAEAQRDFFLPKRAEDAFGNTSFVRYDRSRLVAIEVEDASGNCTTAGQVRSTAPGFAPAIDWRLLLPTTVTDENDNRELAAFDALGMVVATASAGKQNEPGGRPKGDLLSGFDTTHSSTPAFFRAPAALASAMLGNTTRRFVYDLYAYARTRGQPTPSPIAVASIGRSTHVSDLAPGAESDLQLELTYSDALGRVVQAKSLVEADSGDDSQSDQRWLASAWVTLNHKGNPVRRHEPFFTSTHEYEPGRATPVSTTVIYDPLDRVVGTLLPDHSYEKIAFDAWGETHWDANDTCATSADADTDIGHRVRLLPRGDYFPSWPDRSAPGDASPEEARARDAAAMHAGTPKRTLLDALGRAFLVVSHNRTPTTAGSVDTLLSTFSELDAAGLERSVVDATRLSTGNSTTHILDDGRIALACTYDLSGRRLFETTIDSGERRTLTAADGQPVYSWDHLGRRRRLEYDAMRRHAASHLAVESLGLGVREICIEKTLYGDATLKAVNLCGRLQSKFDTSGVLTIAGADFAGNIRDAARTLLVDFRRTPDWAAAPALRPQIYRTTAEFDALGRLIAESFGAVGQKAHAVRRRYNRRGLVDQIHVVTPDGAASVYLHDATYDHHGLRTRCRHANGVTVHADYDARTSRLSRLVSIRASGTTVQSLSYTYDPVGNIAEIRDQAQPTIYFDGDAVAATSQYQYDALYQLRRATGREHDAASAAVAPDPYDSGRSGRAHPGDWRKMRAYVEEYQYDDVGNLLAVKHRVPSDRTSSRDYTRSYHYARPSKIEPHRMGNALTSTTVGAEKTLYSYDELGQTTTMGHLPLMRWDHEGRLVATATQVVTNGPPETTYYTYDTESRRVRKARCAAHTEQLTEERIYIGDFEIYVKYDGSGSATLTRETLRVNDGLAPVALIETRTDAASPSLVRFQYTNQVSSACVELDGSPSAALVSYEEYYPYGATSFQARTSLTEGAKRFRYNSRERDEESGLSHHEARYCAPWLGRWTSVDPENSSSRQGQSRRLCSYVAMHNNPIRFADSTGRWPDPDSSMPDGSGAGLAAAGHATIEAAIWNPTVFGSITPAAKLATNSLRGVILEQSILGGNNLGRYAAAADRMTSEVVQQIKSTSSLNKVAQIARDATRDAGRYITNNAAAAGRAAQARILVPSGTPKAVLDSARTALDSLRKAIPTATRPPAVTAGLPGAGGVALKALAPVGMVLSGIELGSSIAKGDAAGVLRDGSGVAAGALGTAAIAAPMVGGTLAASVGTAAASAAPVVGAFAIGTSIGSLLEKTLNVSEYSSSAGAAVHQRLREAGAGDGVATVIGGAASLLAIPVAISYAAVVRAGS